MSLSTVLRTVAKGAGRKRRQEKRAGVERNCGLTLRNVVGDSATCGARKSDRPVGAIAARPYSRAFPFPCSAAHGFDLGGVFFAMISGAANQLADTQAVAFRRDARSLPGLHVQLAQDFDRRETELVEQRERGLRAAPEIVQLSLPHA